MYNMYKTIIVSLQYTQSMDNSSTTVNTIGTGLRFYCIHVVHTATLTFHVL